MGGEIICEGCLKWVSKIKTVEQSEPDLKCPILNSRAEPPLHRTKLSYVVPIFLVTRSQETDYGVIWSLVTCLNLPGTLGDFSTRP